MFNREILQYFENWKVKKRRKPLIVRGARQVGKTVAVTIFGKNSFKNTIIINLDKEDHLSMFKRMLPINELIQLIELKFGRKIVPGSTLLFVDEIQNSPIAMAQMRYFYEEMPGLHVMAAGSLLEIKIKAEGFSFPVGRVEYAYMYPVRFTEFLAALGDTQILSYLSSVNLNSEIATEIKNIFEKKFREYILVGGMPEAVSEYINSKSLINLDSIYESILTGFKDDVFKYSTEAKAQYLQHVIENSPKAVGKAVKYEKFGDSGYRSREMKEAFETLEKAMIVKRIYSTKGASLPIINNLRKAPKLIFLDSGLVNYSLSARDSIFTAPDLNNLYYGQISEQIVGQSLLASGKGKMINVSYWYNDARNAQSEIDFLVQYDSNIVPIEVKSGKTGTLRSLHIFMEKSRIPVAIRVYSGDFQIHQMKRKDGTVFKLLSIPFYLLNSLENLYSQLI